MYLIMNQQDILGDKMDYQDGFEDGVKFTREVVIANIRKWAEDHDDGAVIDWVADQIEFGTLNNDL